MAIGFNAPNQRRPHSTTTTTINFRLLPANLRDYLQLETGEIFGAHNGTIRASLLIRVASSEADFQHSSMRYIEQFDDVELPSPARIHFDIFVTSAAFENLASNLRAKLIPETIWFDLPLPVFSGNEEQLPPLKYSWEPDGSGKIWHNKLHPVVFVEGVSMQFRIANLQPHPDDEDM